MDALTPTFSSSSSGLPANILVIEDDPSFQTLYRDLLAPNGHTVVCTESPVEARSRLRDFSPEIILLDVFFGGLNGLEAIPDLLACAPLAKVIVVSAAEEGQMAMEALRRGAYDFLNKDEKDFPARLLLRVGQTLETVYLQRRIDIEIESRGGYAFGDEVIVGLSDVMREVYRVIDKVALSGCSALISGESGTGKELVARAIHLKGRRRAAPFVSIDCGAMAKSVLESELFGVAKEYPGFHNRERLVGRLELAGDGVLLLDEIGNMEADLQVKLLRVLEEKEFQPLGEEHALPLSAQVVASTNVDLTGSIARGQFREDLFFRLNEIPVSLPPLRARIADVPLLVTHFLDRHNRRTGGDRRMTPDALDKLMTHRWPGNVRELKKTLERALVLSERRFITDVDIQFAQPSSVEPAPAPSVAPLSTPSSNLPLREAEEAFRRAYVEDVLRRVGGDKLQAAVLLGIDLRTIQRILARK